MMYSQSIFVRGCLGIHTAIHEYTYTQYIYIYIYIYIATYCICKDVLLVLMGLMSSFPGLFRIYILHEGPADLLRSFRISFARKACRFGGLWSLRQYCSKL